MHTTESHKHHNSAFLALARKLGQSEERLLAGERVHTQVQIRSLEEFREIFAGGLCDEHRSANSKDLAVRHQAGLSASNPLTRLIDHVSGGGSLTADDAHAVTKMFPLTITAVSQADMPVTSNITYGPSASPVVLNVGTLTFNGGSITTLNTVLTLSAATLAFGPTPGTLPYHIGVLGANGTAGAAGTAGPPPNPPQAKSGSNASPRSPGVCTGVGSGGDGSKGAAGNAGGDGSTGKDGLPSLPADIKIQAFSTTSPGNLVLFTQSGAGGQGGVGGLGGVGQQGGNGGNGCDSGCEGTNGGNAGSGGVGGAAGNGGAGGNGVNGFNITVTVPKANLGNVFTSTAVAAVGQGGLAGTGGLGGQPGSAGKGGKGCSNGSSGQAGDQGASAKTGSPGTQQGSAGQFFINGV